MFETDGPPAEMSFSDYQKGVDETWRHQEADPDWGLEYGTLIRGEFLEFNSQHGITPDLLRQLGRAESDEEKKRILVKNQAHVDGGIEEIGDLLWFSFRSAMNLGIDPGKAAAKALGTYSGIDHLGFKSFTELQRVVSELAERVQVPSKSALRYPSRLQNSANWVSLTDQPLYVTLRMISRLSRALEEGQMDIGPYSASLLETLPEVEDAVGDCLIVCAYLSHDILSVSLEETASRNLHKLQNRKSNGKD